MKMEPSNETIFNAEMRPEDLKVSAKEIGREFVRHYYTMLSEKPLEAGRFYSHESYFMHNDMLEVCGTENIQKAIQQIGFEDCKARIYSITGTHTVNNGLVLQVCGELALKGSPKRRFCQTFVLYPQSPKKFYVHNDILQWVDKAFDESVMQQKGQAAEEILIDEQINGHKNASENITIDDPSEEVAEPENIDIQLDDKSCLISPSPKVVETTENPVAEVEPIQQQTGPRSWAKLVSSGATGKQMNYISTYQPPQPQPTRTIQPVQVKPSSETDNRRENRQSLNRDSSRPQQQSRENGTRQRPGPPSRTELTLFVSNIPRSDLTISWDALKAELRTTFEKYGKVKEVSIPKTVQTSTVDRIYAFIDMESQEGINKVYEECRADEHNRKYLQVELSLINWTGEVHISNRKEGGPSNRSFENKGGRGNFGGSGGNRNDQRRSGGGPRRDNNTTK